MVMTFSGLTVSILQQSNTECKTKTGNSISLSPVVFVHLLAARLSCASLCKVVCVWGFCCRDDPGGKARLFAKRVNELREVSGERLSRMGRDCK